MKIKKKIFFSILVMISSDVFSEQVVKIGHVGPLTGNISHLGKDNENGVRLALEDFNSEKIQINHEAIRFELISQDDMSDPRTATIVAERLMDSEVKGVVGHLNSGTTMPASRIYNDAGVPMISPSATSSKLTQQGYKTIFRTIANDEQQGSKISEFSLEKLGKKIAIIDDRTAYGQGLGDQVQKSVLEHGGSLVAREFTTNQSTDFMSILTKIKSHHPDVIIFLGMDAQAAPLLKQIFSLGIKVNFITGDGACTAEMIQIAGDALSDRVYCTRAGMPISSMPKGLEFKKKYKKRFGMEVQLYAPYAYDATYALLEAMKMSNSIDPKEYVKALKKISFQGVSGKIAFDDRGDILDGMVTVYRFLNQAWQAL